MHGTGTRTGLQVAEGVNAESVSKKSTQRLGDGMMMIFRDTKKEDEVKWRGVARSEIHFLLLVPRISFTFPRRRPQLQFKWMRSHELEVRVRMSPPRLRTGQECQFVAHVASRSL